MNDHVNTNYKEFNIHKWRINVFREDYYGNYSIFEKEFDIKGFDTIEDAKWFIDNFLIK